MGCEWVSVVVMFCVYVAIHRNNMTVKSGIGNPLHTLYIFTYFVHKIKLTSPRIQSNWYFEVSILGDLMWRFDSVSNNRCKRVLRRVWGMAVPLLNLGAGREWAVNTTPRPLYPREGDPIVHAAGWTRLDVSERCQRHQGSNSKPIRPVACCYTDWRIPATDALRKSVQAYWCQW
jgi:hypothetical protein